MDEYRERFELAGIIIGIGTTRDTMRDVTAQTPLVSTASDTQGTTWVKPCGRVFTACA